MSWHVTAPLWEAYTAGSLNTSAQASIEVHVTSCATCRVAARTYAADVHPLWDSIHHTVSQPRLPALLRVLRRWKVPERDLAVLGASDSLALSWAVAVGGALTAVIATAVAGARQEFTFLLLVPLVQVVAVMAAFAATDVLHELVTATPVNKVRVALLRAAAALSIAVPSTAAIGLLVPNLDGLAFAWALPALGLVLAALVLHTWCAPWTAAGITAAGWTALVAAGHSHLGEAGVQAGAACVAVALAAFYVVRTRTLQWGGVR